MRRRWIQGVPAAALGCAIGLGAWACDAGSMAGDAMVDAGSMLSDAGEMVRDAMGADAAAQDPPVEVRCDIERRWTTDYGTVTSETTFWYAEVRDPAISIDAVRTVRSTLCDYERWGGGECPAGATCTGVYYVAPPLRCRTQSNAEVEDGVVRVICGSRSRQVREDGTVTVDSGSRAASVRISIVR